MIQQISENNTDLHGAMPTFTTVALDSLIEPKASKGDINRENKTWTITTHGSGIQDGKTVALDTKIWCCWYTASQVSSIMQMGMIIQQSFDTFERKGDFECFNLILVKRHIFHLRAF